MTAESYEAWVAGGERIAFGRFRVFTRVEGEGPAVIFLHGFPTSSFDWAGIVAGLRASFRCVTFDFLGFGASDKPRIDYSYDLQLGALVEVARAAGVSRALVVAHDYGATLAQELLALDAEGRAPFSLDGVVLFNGGIEPALHRPFAIQRLLASRVGPFVAPLLVTKRTFRRSFGRIITNLEAIDFDAHWAAIARGGGARTTPRLLHYMAERKRRRDRWVGALRTSRVPLGLVWGRRDPISGAHVLAWARSALPRAKILDLDVGHYPQLEATSDAGAWLTQTFAEWSAGEAHAPAAPARR